MPNLSQAKTLGGIGSILLLLSIIPWAGFLLAIVGFILVLMAVKQISDVVGDKTIINNMLIAVILSVVGFTVGLIMGLATLMPLVMGMGSPLSMMGPTWSIIATVLLTLLIIWAFLIASAIFLRRSFNSIASSLKVGMFSTAALLYLIGAALVVAFGIGFIIIFVAEILQTIAFFSIPEQPPAGQAGYT